MYIYYIYIINQPGFQQPFLLFGDYTTQLFVDYDIPLKGSLLLNQYNGM